MSTTYSGSFPASNALNSNGARTAITKRGVGMWWKATMSGGDSVVEKVRIKNRHDCCGERLTGTKVTIGGELCGTVPRTGNGQWVEVKCSEPQFGGEVQLTTSGNTWLQINAVEVYGWSVSQTKKTTSTGSGKYNVKPNTKAGLNQGSAKQSSNYSNSMYLANWAFQGPNKFSHTKRGIGQWWEVAFN